MPELPDIALYIDALGDRVAGATLDGVRLGSPFLLRSVAPPLKQDWARTIEELESLTPDSRV